VHSLAIRQQQAKPIFDDLEHWLMELLAKISDNVTTIAIHVSEYWNSARIHHIRNRGKK
jgi:hypothetical protein